MAKAKKSSILPMAQTTIPEWLWSDDAFSERYPSLFEFLASGIWEGEQRKGGSISLFCGQGRLKVCFLDKQTQMAFYAVLSPGEHLLGELEGILAGEHDAWQPVRGGSGGRPVF